MITESTLVSQGTSVVKGDVTEDVADAVVADSAKNAEEYKEWLDKAASICGSEMKGDIDPVVKQSENILPVANSLASQLGLEDTSAAAALIAEEEEAEMNKMDEDSRQYDFTAEDIGLCTTDGSYSPALENAWINIDNCLHNVQRLDMHGEDAKDLIMAIESAGAIDYDTAVKLRDRVPGSLDGVNIKMFTKLPSSVGYKLAQEGSLAGKIIIGGLIIAGTIFLIYKILSWTIEGIKAITRVIKRIRERRANYNRTVSKVAEETFDPEVMDVDKIAKSLFNDPTVEVKAKLKACGRQPLELRNIKWTSTKDFAHLMTPILINHLDDIDGSEVSHFNDSIEALVEDVHDCIGHTQDIMNNVISCPGEFLNSSMVAEELDKKVAFVTKYLEDFGLPYPTTNNSSVEQLRVIYEWLDELIKPTLATTLRNAPPAKFINEMGNIHFDLLDDEFASQITTIRDTLDPKGKKTNVAEDTPEQADIRKEIIKDLSVTFLALSNLIRSVYHYTLYIESVIIAEDQFINKVKKVTA